MVGHRRGTIPRLYRSLYVSAEPKVFSMSPTGLQFGNKLRSCDPFNRPAGAAEGDWRVSNSRFGEQMMAIRGGGSRGLGVRGWQAIVTVCLLVCGGRVVTADTA